MRATCSYVIITASLFAGSLYAEKSLWGDIDNPNSGVDTSTSVQVQGYLPQNQTTSGKTTGTASNATTPQQAANAVAAVAVAQQQKTTCQIISAQTKLDPTLMKSAAMQNSLRTNSQFMPAQYKALLASPESMNALYDQYRQQYIKTYCRG